MDIPVENTDTPRAAHISHDKEPSTPPYPPAGRTTYMRNYPKCQKCTHCTLLNVRVLDVYATDVARRFGATFKHSKASSASYKERTAPSSDQFASTSSTVMK